MLAIYIPDLNSRSTYIFKHFFRQMFDGPFDLYSDRDIFEVAEGRKVSYASQPLGDELFFQSHGLLSERGVEDQDVDVFKYRDIPVFFQVGQDSALPFDPFAAAFYMLSRYEEYFPHQSDEHQRYMYTESLADQHDFLDLPVVDHWMLMVRDVIMERYPEESPKPRKFNFLATFNVDLAYRYLEKGTIRNLVGFVSDFFHLKFKDVWERAAVQLRLQNDPHDTFEYIIEKNRKNSIASHFFFLLGDFNEYDRNISYFSERFASTIKYCSDYFPVGLLASYRSQKKHENLRREKERLERITFRSINSTRQHLMRLQLPATLNRLLEEDIRHDYSMGFAHRSGFRAGTCTPFYFYDLENNTATPLKLYPFAIRDEALREHEGLNPEQAIEQIAKIVDAVKAVDGTLISVFYSYALSERGEWKGWRKVYNRLIRMARA